MERLRILPPTTIHRWDWVVVLVVMAAAGALSLLPAPDVPPDLSGADKIVHFALYAVLAFTTSRAAGGREADREDRGSDALVAAVVGFAVAVVFGGAMEWLQGTLGRDPSWGDLLADMGGAVAGSAFWWRRSARRNR